MNCRKAERQIYLYTELTPLEQEQIDRHISTCAGCARLFEKIKAQKGMILKSRGNPDVSDAPALTRRIMESIQEKQQRKQRLSQRIFQVPSMEVLRYSMAVASFVLMAVFLSDYNAGTRMPEPYKALALPRTAALNSAAFHEVFLKEKEVIDGHNVSFYRCIVNCLHTQNGDCKDCQKQIAKLN